MTAILSSSPPLAPSSPDIAMMEGVVHNLSHFVPIDPAPPVGAAGAPEPSVVVHAKKRPTTSDQGGSPAKRAKQEVTLEMLQGALAKIAEDQGVSWNALTREIADDNFVLAHRALTALCEANPDVDVLASVQALYKIVVANTSRMEERDHVNVLAVGLVLDLPEEMIDFWNRLLPLQRQHCLTAFFDTYLLQNFADNGMTLWQRLQPILFDAPADLIVKGFQKIKEGFTAHPDVDLSELVDSAKMLSTIAKRSLSQEKWFDFCCLLSDLGFIPKEPRKALGERSIYFLNYLICDGTVERWKEAAQLRLNTFEKLYLLFSAKISVDRGIPLADFENSCGEEMEIFHREIVTKLPSLIPTALIQFIEASITLGFHNEALQQTFVEHLKTRDLTTFAPGTHSTLIKHFAAHPSLLSKLPRSANPLSLPTAVSLSASPSSGSAAPNARPSPTTQDLLNALKTLERDQGKQWMEVTGALLKDDAGGAWTALHHLLYHKPLLTIPQSLPFMAELNRLFSIVVTGLHRFKAAEHAQILANGLFLSLDVTSFIRALSPEQQIACFDAFYEKLFDEWFALEGFIAWDQLQPLLKLVPFSCLRDCIARMQIYYSKLKTKNEKEEFALKMTPALKEWGRILISQRKTLQINVLANNLAHFSLFFSEWMEVLPPNVRTSFLHRYLKPCSWERWKQVRESPFWSASDRLFLFTSTVSYPPVARMQAQEMPEVIKVANSLSNEELDAFEKSVKEQGLATADFLYWLKNEKNRRLPKN